MLLVSNFRSLKWAGTSDRSPDGVAANQTQDVLFLVEVEQHKTRLKQCKSPFKMKLYKALAS